MSDLEKLWSVLSSCMDSKACLDTKHLSGQKSHFFVRILPADRSVLVFIADYLSLGWVHVGGIWWQGRKGPARPEHWTSSGNPPRPRGKDKPQVSKQSSFPIQLIPLVTLKVFEKSLSGFFFFFYLDNLDFLVAFSASLNMAPFLEKSLCRAELRKVFDWILPSVYFRTHQKENAWPYQLVSHPDLSCLFGNETPMRSTRAITKHMWRLVL